MKTLRIVFAVTALSTLSFADQLPIAGHTAGSFAEGVTTAAGTRWLDLTFANRAFDPVTPDAAGNATIANIGKFMLGNCTGFLGICSEDYNGTDAFNLNVEFTMPAALIGAPANFTADLTGTVGSFLGIPYGHVDVLFDTYSKAFDYTTSTGTGHFVFSLAGLDGGRLRLAANTNATLGATITEAFFHPAQNPAPDPIPQVPEPASMLLLGSALLIGAGALRRRARIA